MQQRCLLFVMAMLISGSALHAVESERWQPRSGHKMVVFNDTLVIAGGMYGFDKHFFFSDVWSSQDGYAWSRAETHTAGFSRRHLHGFLVFNEALWVLGGQGGIYYHDVWRSEDGAAWEEITSAASWSPRRGMACVVHADRLFLLGGEGLSGPYNDIWKSADGEAWESVTAGIRWEPRWEHAAVSFDGMLYILGGASEIGVRNDVWRSEDGVSWEQAGTLPEAVKGHTASTFRNAVYISGGMAKNGKPLQQVWKSSDGVSWEVVTDNAAWPARARHATAVYDNRIWLAGGVTAEGDSNDVWRSRNGANWSPAQPAGCLGQIGCDTQCNATKRYRGISGDMLLFGALLSTLLFYR